MIATPGSFLGRQLGRSTRRSGAALTEVEGASRRARSCMTVIQAMRTGRRSGPRVKSSGVARFTIEDALHRLHQSCR